VRPQLQLISSKTASRQLAHAPLWQICWQLCVPHFSSRPQVRMQMCSDSMSSKF
jgi:hypothetical protein